MTIVSQSSTTSNLSKIAPKLRTTGRVTGNFGRNKCVAGSNMNQIGLSDKEHIKVTRESDYIARMYQVLDNSDDQKVRNFAYSEIKKYLIKTNKWMSN